ncbi:MAG: SPOR domain-containing protein [Treponema sp.]|nr:SPOR domain-containing protein [Candidatus Treponema equifaecale]
MKKFVGIIAAFCCSTLIFAQAATAKGAVTAASNKGNVNEAISYLKTTIEKMTVASEKRSVYTFLAGLEEQMGSYADAQKHYVAAAGIAGNAQSVAGIPNKNSEQLVIDAIRCALSAGDYAAADSYLTSSVRNSKDADVTAHVKLYEQWSALCKAKSSDDTKESVSMLRAYSEMESMKSVRPSVLLTLWHLTGENSYSEKLKKSYPKSMEAAVVKGELQILPTPFWYFVPKSGSDLPDINVGSDVVESSSEKTEGKPAVQKEPKTEKTEVSSGAEKIVKQQLGLFRDKVNAEKLRDKVKAKGFDAIIESEVRPSGTTYYLVVVKENKAGTIGKDLKNAGFECYPVFD